MDSSDTSWVELASIGSTSVGAIVALVGLLGTIGQASQVSRARRRVLRAVEMKDRSHCSLSEQYEALHREESARYLALVKAQTGREPVWELLAAIVASLSAFVIVLMMAWNGGDPHVWAETIATVVPFALLYGFSLWMVLDKASSRSRAFVDTYRSHVGPENTQTPAPGEDIAKLINKLGNKAPYGLLLVAAVASSVFLLSVVGFSIGRNFTETGEAMRAEDGQGIWVCITVAILLLLMMAAASVRLLFPQMPRHGESLWVGAESAPAAADPADGDPSVASSSGAPASDNPPEQ